MKDLADEIIRRFLKRQPTSDDYKRINDMLDLFPDEIRSSPGVMIEIVLRAEGIRKFESIMGQAITERTLRAESDASDLVTKMAVKALAALRDKLPIDSADRMGRLYRFGSIFSAIVLAIGFAAGWTYSNTSSARFHMTHQAASEAQFSSCIDSAEGAATSDVDRAGTGLRYNPKAYRDYARGCAAEYADRRAGLG